MQLSNGPFQASEGPFTVQEGTFGSEVGNKWLRFFSNFGELPSQQDGRLYELRRPVVRAVAAPLNTVHHYYLVVITNANGDKHSAGGNLSLKCFKRKKVAGLALRQSFHRFSD